MASPDRYTPTPSKPVDPPHTKSQLSTAGPSSSRLVVHRFSDQTDLTQKIDLATALQYGTAQGYPPLLSFLKQFATKNMHPNVPYAGGADITLTVGSTDGFSKCVLSFITPWSEGDPIENKQGLLAEEYAFGNSLNCAAPRGVTITGVKVDSQGMLANGPGGLEDVLENWDYRQGARPHLMYTVTMGQNPTGGVLSTRRRKEIYALCQKYDIIIIEDDPYWYLQYPSAAAANVTSGRATVSPLENDGDDDARSKKSSGFPFLDSLVPSYLSMDVDGRVVRLDTFSKTVAPGCRLGWITAQPYLVERFLRLTESGTQQPSGFVQSVVAQLLIGSTQPHTSPTSEPLSKGWDVSGWVRWLEGLRGNYERRMQTMCTILDEGKCAVKSGTMPALDALADANDEDGWSVVQKVQTIDYAWPVGGMFVWIEILFDNHPLAGKVEGAKLSQALWAWLTTKPYLVLASPGAMFGANEQIKQDRAWRFHRLCFAGVDEEEIAPISRRYVDGLHAFWRIKDTRVIDKILDDMNQSTERPEGLALLTGPC